MNFHVMTLFPEMIRQGLGTSITGKAIDQGTITLNAVDIRDFSHDEKHHHVDDYPYGGGAGMVIGPEPVFDCFSSIKEKVGDGPLRVIYMTPQGKVFSQSIAEELSKEEHLVFLCGHYEGIDERVLDEIVTDHLSVGDYVLTGGELPAMVMIDAIARLVPGVLNNDDSARYESFQDGLLEYPQYTRPPVYHGKEVPPVLLTGDHKKIEAWRNQKSVERTLMRRPDLFEHKELDSNGKKLYLEAKLKANMYQLICDEAPDWLSCWPDEITKRIVNAEENHCILDAGYMSDARAEAYIADGIPYHALDPYHYADRTKPFDYESCQEFLNLLSAEEDGKYDLVLAKAFPARLFPKDVKKAVKRLAQLLHDQGKAYIEIETVSASAIAIQDIPYMYEDELGPIYKQPEDIWKKILGSHFYVRESGTYTYPKSGKEVLFFKLKRKVKKSL